MRKLFPFLFLGCVSQAFAGYSYTTPIIINHVQVGTNTASEVNFPVLVSTNGVLFSTSASGGHMVNASGYDLVFSTYADCHYLLNWDTDTVNNTGSKTMNTWVKVPAISSTTDTVFYMCYGNAAITSYQGISSGTWDSNYKAIFHYGNGLTVATNDSTGNRNNATNNSVTASTSGVIGGAGSFNGSNSFFSLSTISISSVTVSVWSNVPNTSTANAMMWEKSPVNGEWELFYETLLKIRGSVTDNNTSATGPSANAWHYIVGTLMGTTGVLYVDGTQVATGTEGAIPNGSGAVYIGVWDGSGYPYSGLMDESRLSNIVRSADWVKTEYNNQNSPSTFLTFDTEIKNALLNELEKGIVLDGGKIAIGGKLTVK